MYSMKQQHLDSGQFLAHLDIVGSTGGGSRRIHDDWQPPDWRECYDANYKRTYFFNVASGESRWRAPDDRYVPYEKPIEGPVRAQSVDPAALKMAAERVKRSLSESAMPFVAEHG